MNKQNKSNMTSQTNVRRDFYSRVVKRLILQFKEYEYLNVRIKDLENNKFLNKLKKNYKSVEELDKQINLLKLDRQKVSDEMTFANPIIWIMYKYKAYKNTNNEIKTVEEFINHCSPEGYICTKRYKFLSKYVKIDRFFNKKDNLRKLYKSGILLEIVNNQEFMKSWKQNEYLIKDGKVSKWEC